MKRPLPVLDPRRVRAPTRSFAWVDHRLRDRLHELDLVDMALYLFLLLAADAQGLSCWRLDRIGVMLGHVPKADLFRARQRLMDLELIVYQPWSEHAPDGSYQVLALR